MKKIYILTLLFSAISFSQCITNLGGGLEPSFVTFRINGTTFEHNTYSEPTEYYHAYPQTETLIAGQTYPIYTFTSSEAVIAIWMDYNQNDIFETSEYKQLVNNMQSQNTTNFTVSTASNSGLVKMRIRSRAYGSAINNTDACSAFGSGETRDYTFTINNNLNISSQSALTSNFKVFPNPCHNIINIESYINFSNIKIYNMMGQLVTQTESSQIDISNLISGTYILEIISNEATKEYYKFIKS